MWVSRPGMQGLRLPRASNFRVPEAKTLKGLGAGPLAAGVVSQGLVGKHLQLMYEMGIN